MNQTEEIAILKDRISELQGMLLLTVAELKALKEMSIILWEAAQVQVHETESIEGAIHRMALEHRQNLLSSVADLDMANASQLTKNIERFLK